VGEDEESFRVAEEQIDCGSQEGFAGDSRKEAGRRGSENAREVA
jgi:hypothetical protein